MTTLTTQTVHEFLLPDVGEGLTEAEIVTWHVAVGDTVEVNQILVDIETAKSIVELPSPFAGTVVAVHADVGQTIDVGRPLISIGAAEPSPTPGTDDGGQKDHSPEDGAPEQGEDEPKLLVGYGARESNTPRRRRNPPAGAPSPTPQGSESKHTRPRAKPPVRKLAQVLGIDLATITPSGPDGTIARADVLSASQQHPSPSPNSVVAPPATTGGSETRMPIKGVRKHTAAAMVASAFTAPHVTEFITVDVTKTLELRDTIQRRREFHDVKLTPLTFVARAYLRALSRTPMATARWDEHTQEIVLPGRINLGIAAATPRGLVVPNIKDAQTFNLLELATAINDLAATARAGKSTPESMASGTTTITNVGVFGVDTGTPILNPGETSILALGTIRRQPWVVQDEAGERIEPRSILQLALSFDHRVLDGQQGSELLADTAAILAEPGLALL